MIAFWKVVKTKTNLRRCNVIIYYYSQGSYMPKFPFDWRRSKKLIDFFVVNWYLDCAFKKGVPNAKYLIGGREMHKQTRFRLLDTGVPLGCVLGPLLFAPHNHDCTPRHQESSVVKFCRWHITNGVTRIRVLIRGKSTSLQSGAQRTA